MKQRVDPPYEGENQRKGGEDGGGAIDIVIYVLRVESTWYQIWLSLGSSASTEGREEDVYGPHCSNILWDLNTGNADLFVLLAQCNWQIPFHRDKVMGCSSLHPCIHSALLTENLGVRHATKVRLCKIHPLPWTHALRGQIRWPYTVQQLQVIQ